MAHHELVESIAIGFLAAIVGTWLWELRSRCWARIALGAVVLSWILGMIWIYRNAV